MKQIIFNVLNRLLLGFGYEVKRRKEFDTENYTKREKLRQNYREVCNSLSQLLEFYTVLDLGSANGFVIDEFVNMGKNVIGIELSEEVKPLLSEAALKRTRFADATTIGQIGEYDLITCIEVAEHIPPEKSELLLDVITVNAKKYVYFTAATPFQSGIGHINCRPHFFWINEFRKRGFELHYELTEEFNKKIEGLEPCYYLALNSLIFVKK